MDRYAESLHEQQVKDLQRQLAQAKGRAVAAAEPKSPSTPPDPTWGLHQWRDI